MRLSYPTNIKIVKLPCTGKIDVLYLLKAFEDGADGVFVAGCMEGDCHYLTGNLRARKRVDYVKKIKDNRLELADLEGGTFTVSNGGVYGSLLSTPILNMPQSGILGMHKIEKRPVVVDDQIVVRPMMYVALSYDHRIVDGKGAVTFLKRVKEFVENPERIVLEV